MTKILDNNNLDLLCRGYEFFWDKELVIIFSSPNYCGEFDNSAAMMCVLMKI